MWTNAQEKVKIRLKELHAELVGNIVLTDKAPNLISAYTIVKWMYSGKKKNTWVFFQNREYLIRTFKMRLFLESLFWNP